MALSRTARRRCRIGALIGAEVLLACAVVLLVYASVQMFRIPYHTAKADGLTRASNSLPHRPFAFARPHCVRRAFVCCRADSPMAHYLACDQKAERMSGFGGLAKIAKIRCIAAQAPFVYAFVITAAWLVATGVAAAVATAKRSRSGLYAFPVLCAVTIAMLFGCVYVYLIAFTPLTQLVPCDGLTEAQAKVMQKARLGVCAVTPTGDRADSAFTLFDLMLVWAVGWFAALIALFTLFGVVSGAAARVLHNTDAFDSEIELSTPRTRSAASTPMGGHAGGAHATVPTTVVTTAYPALPPPRSYEPYGHTARPLPSAPSPQWSDQRLGPNAQRQERGIEMPHISAQYFAPPHAGPPPTPAAAGAPITSQQQQPPKPNPPAAPRPLNPFDDPRAQR